MSDARQKAAAKADLPDRAETSKALMMASAKHGPIASVDDAGVVVVDLSPLTDAVLALLRGEQK